MRLDSTDLALLEQLLTRPRAGRREYARSLGLARGTVQSRLGRMERGGVISDYAPILSPAELGYEVLAYVHLQLAQGHLDPVSKELLAVPQVIEAHSVAGDGDMLCRVVALDTADLEYVVQRLLDIDGVVRTRTEVALTERIPLRLKPLLRRLAVHEYEPGTD